MVGVASCAVAAAAAAAAVDPSSDARRRFLCPDGVVLVLSVDATEIDRSPPKVGIDSALGESSSFERSKNGVGALSPARSDAERMNDTKCGTDGCDGRECAWVLIDQSRFAAG